MNIRLTRERGSKRFVEDKDGEFVLLDYTTVFSLAKMLAESQDQEISAWGKSVLNDFEPKFDVNELTPGCYEFTYHNTEKHRGTIFTDANAVKKLVLENWTASDLLYNYKSWISSARKLS